MPQPEKARGQLPAKTMTAETLIAGARSEATKIEGERVRAEVFAAIMAARSAPRCEDDARAQIIAACSSGLWGENAFYSYPRSGQVVTGMTIQVAIEMARIWGNLEFGIRELSREASSSEMQAYCWDQERNTRSQITFIVPHNGRARDDRDVYENNANQGARRLREMIFRIIPRDIRVQAEAALRESVRAAISSEPQGADVRRSRCVEAFGKIGVTKEALEKRAGKKVSELTVDDLAELGILLKSIVSKTITVEEAFGSPAAATGAKAAALASSGAPGPVSCT